jgi:hypothetical protein
MNGTNTTALASSSYEEGYKTGVDHVLADLNDLLYTDNVLNDEERKTVVKIYDILAKMYPA